MQNTNIKEPELFDASGYHIENSTVLIEASAGTGKTYTITSLVMRLIIENGFKVEDILVVTFTEAAAMELKGRIFSRLNDIQSVLTLKKEPDPDDEFLLYIQEKFQGNETALSRVNLAIKSFDLAAVFTIHGFCFRVLSEHAFETGNFFESEILKNDKDLFLRGCEDFYRNFISSASREEALFVYGQKLFPEALLRFVSKYSNYENLEIRPDNPKIDLSSHMDSFSSMRSKVAEIYKAHGEEVYELLKNQTVLNKTKYPDKKLDERFAFLNEILKDKALSHENYVQEKINGRKNQFLYFLPETIEDAVKKNCKPITHLFFDECGKLYNSALELSKAVENFKAWFMVQAFFEVKEKVSEMKLENAVLGFQDFLTKVNSAIESDDLLLSGLRKRYRAALIDEFQDTDPVQYNIFKKIFKGFAPLFFIGDPKQAIYRFRGADIFAYIDAKNDSDKVFTLDRNFRSSKNLVNGLNSIFSLSSNPFVFNGIEFQNITANREDNDGIFLDDSAKPPVELVFIGEDAASNKGEAEDFIFLYTVSEVSRLLRLGHEERLKINDRPVSPEDIAVLVIKNEDGKKIKDLFEKNNIPAVLESNESVFSSPEALALLELLEASFHCNDIAKTVSLICGDLFLKNSSYIKKFNEDHLLQNVWIDRIKRLNSIWQEKGILSMLETAYHEYEILKNAAILKTGERKITNLLHLCEILHEEEKRNRHGMESLLKWFKRAINDGGLSEPNYELRLEGDKGKVRILTVHKSKGLEFNIVFSAFIQSEPGRNLKELLYHEDGKLVLDISPEASEKGLDMMKKEQLSEDMRVLYVALTRARYQLFFFIPEFIRKKRDHVLQTLLSKDKITMEDLVSELNKKNPDEISLRKYSDRPELEIFQFPSDGEIEKLNVCRFDRKIRESFKISSFSSLFHGKTLPEKTDSDIDLAEDDVLDLQIFDSKDESIPEEETLFDFKRGAFSGIFFHSIFEDLDFTSGDGAIFDLIDEKLLYYGFEEKWREPVFSMVKNTIEKELLQGVFLSSVGLTDRLSEMEFNFPLNEAHMETFFDNIKKDASSDLFRERLESFDSDIVNGYMKGFIDLVFFCNGKFYIIDWKSNHLGDGFENYSVERLEQEIARAGYFLQYYIYSAALDKYLSYRLGDSYSFEEHFGGVFYIFLRGVNKNDNSGIYFDKPSFNIVKSFSS